ncbi:sporulation protein [Actinomadura luteofluorescens]|uniref:sporulation protein n=1 Tax=Actinomadura luteofluorescens TaxID=46163 RepID=UPI003D8CCD34
MSYGQMAGGGPSVDTILAEPNCKPGGVVAGKVHLRGGAGPAEIRQVTLALMPRMRHHGGETAGPEVYRGALTRGFRLDAGGQRDLAFSIPLPYELPFTTVLGHELPGFTIGMCTEIDVAEQPDPGDIDPISVEPLESQQWVLASIARLGFQITNVTFESSKLRGVSQQLPFHQEIHLNPPPSHQGRIEKVGLAFVASPRAMAFVLRAEDRDTPQDESFGVFQVPHAEAAETDWNAKIGQWLEAAVALPRSSRPGPASHGSPPPPGRAPLPPPGGHSAFPPPPPQAAAAYGGPAEYGSHGNNQFPPPAPAPGQQQPAPVADPGYAPSPPGMPPAPGHGFPPPAHSPMPGHGMPSHGTPSHGMPSHGTPPHGTPPPGMPSHGAPSPAPAHGMPSHGAPPPGAQHGMPSHGAPPPAHGMPSHGAPPPAPPGPVPYAPAAHGGPPPPAPPGPAPYPPPAHVHHGPPGYHGHRHLGHGVAAAGLVGGVAAAGVAGGMAMGALDAAGYAQNVAGYVAGAPVDAFGNALAGYAGNVAGNVIADAAGGIAGDIAGDVAGELAGGAAEILGGLLGGLFG